MVHVMRWYCLNELSICTVLILTYIIVQLVVGYGTTTAVLARSRYVCSKMSNNILYVLLERVLHFK